MRIGFLHTAQVHVATFDALLQQAHPGAIADHLVATELLAEAQAGGVAQVQDRFAAALAALSQGNDAVLCSCSTLGPLADKAENSGVVRIDRPAMQAAADVGGSVGIAICLTSTAAASQALFDACAVGTNAQGALIDCTAAWAAFEAGDQPQFASLIAQSVMAAHAAHPFDCIVLAQASMRVAADGLSNLGVPVLTTPEMAVAAVISAAQRKG